MPKDDSYRETREFRRKHKSWFVRGHLAMKLHAERLGANAAWNTHTFWNAVPPRQSFNAGIWLNMENLTAAWAQRFGAVWTVTGPIFIDQHAYGFIGDEDEVPIVLFKILIKASDEPNRHDVLAFIYPQVGPVYFAKKYNHLPFLTTVDEIEKLQVLIS